MDEVLVLRLCTELLPKVRYSCRPASPGLAVPLCETKKNWLLTHDPYGGHYETVTMTARPFMNSGRAVPLWMLPATRQGANYRYSVLRQLMLPLGKQNVTCSACLPYLASWSRECMVWTLGMATQMIIVLITAKRHDRFGVAKSSGWLMP